MLPGPGQSGNAFFATIETRSGGSARYSGTLAHFSLLNGTTIFTRPFNSIFDTLAFDLSPSGDVKLHARPSYSSLLPTSFNAALVAPCPDTDYYARVSPTGALLYATYVPIVNFNFQSPEPLAQKPTLNCPAATAGRFALRRLVSGQMVTLTCGNFGPATAAYSTLDSTGRFPFAFSGYRVRIGGADAPIIAIARGLIAVQVPCEASPENGEFSISITGPNAPPEIISARQTTRTPTLFDTGDTTDSTLLPSLAALNQDGTINSKLNPAALGSIVSVFGSGLDLPGARLITGGLNPLAPLIVTSLLRVGTNSTPVYIGSAPGLSTAVFQANLRLTETYEGSGIRPLPVALAVAENIRQLFRATPTAIVWVKD